MHNPSYWSLLSFGDLDTYLILFELILSYLASSAAGGLPREAHERRGEPQRPRGRQRESVADHFNRNPLNIDP